VPTAAEELAAWHAELTRGEEPAPVAAPRRERGRGIRGIAVAGFERTLDALARSEYASASAFRELLHEKPEEAAKAALEGFTAKRKISYLDIAAEDFKLSTKPFFAIPDMPYVPDFIEHIARGVLTPAGVTGLALGMVLDPLSWLGVGLITKAGRLSQLSRAATTAKRAFPIAEAGKLVFPKGSIIQRGSALARELEREFARTGKIPEPLASTLGGQAATGQRALLQIAEPVIPFTRLQGRPILQIPVPGERAVFEAATKLRDLIRVRAPQVDAALRLFSNFGVPAWVLDDLARLKAEFGIRDEVLVKRLQTIGRHIGREEPGYEGRLEKVIRAVETTEPITEERLRTITRSVPLEHRVFGTARFATSAIDEATGKRVFLPDQNELQEIRRRLGLAPEAKIVRIEDLGSQSVLSPRFPISAKFSEGVWSTRVIEDLKESGDFLALEFRAGEGLAFNPEWGEGIDRVLVDLDLAGRPEAIQAQIRELAERVPKMTTEERAAAEPILEGLARERDRARLGGPSKWRVVLMGRNPQTGAHEARKVIHVQTMDEIYRDVIGPLTVNRRPEEFFGRAVFFDSEAIERIKDEAKRQHRYKKLYAARARMAGRVEEAIEARKPEIIQERAQEFQALEAFMAKIRALGGINIAGTGVVSPVPWAGLDEAYMTYAKRIGRPAESIIRPGGLKIANEDVRRQLAEATGYKPGEAAALTGETAAAEVDAAATYYAAEARRWLKETPWAEARRNLLEADNPDLLKLERYDQALVGLGLREPPVGRPGVLFRRGTALERQRRKELQEFAKGPPVEVPTERPLEVGRITPRPGYQEIRQIAAEVEEIERWREVLPRFSNLPDDLRRAAVGLEKLYAEYATELLPLGGIQARIPGYLHHLRFDALERLKGVAGFVRLSRSTPIQIRKPGFGRRRTMREGLLDINEQMGKEFFLRDVLTAAAIYGRESNRFIATANFVDRTIAKMIDDGSAYRVDARKLDLARMDPRFGVYFPRGRLQFFPARVIPAAKLERQMAEQTFDELAGGKLLVQVKPGDVKTMIGVTKRVEAVVMAREVADVLNRANALYSRPEGLKAIQRVLIGARNTWARWTLFPFPATHVRNGAGNVVNNLFRGLTDPLRYEQMARVQTNQALELVTEAGQALTTPTLRSEMLQNGVVDAGFWSHAGGGRENQLDEAIRTGFGSKTGWRASWDKYGTPGFMRAAMRTMGLVENNARGALYIDRRVKGDTPELAARLVRDTLFDYDNMVPFDQFTRNYIAPFWGWTRRNIPFQVEHLLKRPGYFATTERLIRLIQASSDPDVEALPQWVHESLPVRLFETPDKRGEFRYFLLRNWLPSADLQQLFTPVTSSISMLAPWLRLPIERYYNWSHFFRRPIEPPSGQWGTFLGMEMRRKDIEVLKAIRLLAAIDTVMGPGDNVRRDSYLEENPWGRFLQSPFGIGKLTRVDLYREYQKAGAQHERLLRELRIAQKRAMKYGDEVNARHLAERIRDEAARRPTETRALPPQVFIGEP
jgi:hypothetical protein